MLQATNTLAGHGRLIVDFEDEAKLPILVDSLEGDYHILHFTGHGIPPADGSGLLLEGLQGERRFASIPEILQSLQKVEGKLRLVVIFGCQTTRTLHVNGFTDLALSLSHRKIPAVIATQFSITEEGGLQFAETLYPRLIDGQPLELAFSATRRALLDSAEPHIQADAFSPFLLTANGNCLQTADASVFQSAEQPRIDFSFHLPLSQLSFGFYGRRREYRQIRDGLLYQNHRAVIVHGIGGIGKTALVSHVANRLRHHFKGVYAFDCTSGTLAPERIVLELRHYFEQLGVQALQPLAQQSMPPERIATFLAQVLCQWPLLLIFDNFETQLTTVSGKHQIADEDLRAFFRSLLGTISPVAALSLQAAICSI